MPRFLAATARGTNLLIGDPCRAFVRSDTFRMMLSQHLRGSMKIFAQPVTFELPIRRVLSTIHARVSNSANRLQLGPKVPNCAIESY